MKHWTCTTAVVAVSLVSAALTLLAAEIDLSKLPPPSAKKGVTFEKDIKPLFDASCIRCHGKERPKSGLRLDTLEGALHGSKDGKVIEPGDSKNSELVVAISQLDEEKAMPPKFKPGRRPGGPGGPGGPPPGGPGGNAPQGGPGGGGPGGPGGGGPGGPGGHGFGPPPKPLTPEQVGLVRAWIDQGAK